MGIQPYCLALLWGSTPIFVIQPYCVDPSLLCGSSPIVWIQPYFRDSSLLWGSITSSKLDIVPEVSPTPQADVTSVPAVRGLLETYSTLLPPSHYLMVILKRYLQVH